MTHFRKFLAVVAATAALALAQGPGRGNPRGTPPPPPNPQTMIERRVDSLATLLGLTSDQKAKAAEIFSSAYSAGENLRTSLQSVQQSLLDAVKKNDTTAIDQLSATAGTLTGQLMAIERKADAAFYALLTPEQKTKWDAMPRPGFGPSRRMGPPF